MSNLILQGAGNELRFDKSVTVRKHKNDSSSFLVSFKEILFEISFIFWCCLKRELGL